MATLLVGAAVNVGVGLLINTLFPPPDIEQSGPRLTELGFTSAAYGRFVNIIFGTDRVDGNIIDTPDPAIEELVTVKSESVGGKGGGQRVNTTTYSYFLTGRISWAIEGAEEMLRWWGDGKIIYDATGSSRFLRSGVSMTFYPGGIDQPQDPEEVARRGSNISAYRHLTTLKVDRMPLADYGNRIPNFTAEIGFSTSITIPVLNLVEPTGMEPPSLVSGPGDSYMSFDPDRNEVYSLRKGETSTWSADASALTFNSFIGSNGDAFSAPVVGRDGFSYSQTGNTNVTPLEKRDIETGEVVATFGGSGIPLTDDFTRFGNAGRWEQLQMTLPGVGIKSAVFHLNTSFGTANGTMVDPDLMPLPGGVTTPVIHVFSTADGFPNQTLEGFGIPDHDRNRFFMLLVNTSNDSYDLFMITPSATLGTNGYVLDVPTPVLVRQFTRGTFAAGDDFQGTDTPAGWAVNRNNGDLILSNGVSTVLYNPDTDTILAQEANSDFRGRNNYYTGDIIAYGISDLANGTIRILDTRTLEIVRDVKTDDIPWPSGADGVIHETSVVWDDRVSGLFLSREDTGSTAAVDFRVLKLLVNRINAEGVPLSDVVAALSTSYQRQVMAGLELTEINVTTLAGDTVLGYTLNRRSTMKAALQPLRDRFLFDGVQSDWIMKFPKRGATPTVTIPEEDVGILKRGRDLTDEPAVREIRQDDLSLPMALAVRYRNKNTDYQLDYERDKRHLFPNPTMRSKTEKTIDIPIVEVPTPMKQTVQKHLMTTWNERVSYKTIVPWTYIALDATDVFEMGVFGETAQLRMAENNLGAGWAIEIMGVVEDTKSFSSTISGSDGLGHISMTIPSSLPTRLFPMDAPLLSMADFLITPISNAYMVVSAFEDGWAGATTMKSIDDVSYLPTGTADEEAAVGRVRTAPGAWNIVEGDFPNRWQEASEGGTMTITPLRRADIWASAADEQIVLAGANTIAVIRASDDQVEILNFQDAVLNDDNTVDLSRLLRGRLGTEDIADLGISVGDTVILLSDSTNVKDSGPVVRQRLVLSELDTTIFFKGVTVGTLLEDAPVISAVYTGRDIRPYSVAGLRTTGFIGSDLTILWNRRARGPLAAEWLDGTGVVPLNELIEQYLVTLSDGTNDVIKIVDDVETVLYTESDQSPLTPPLTIDCQMVSGVSSAILSPSVIIPVGALTLGPTPTIVGTESNVFTSGTDHPVNVPGGTLDGHVLLAHIGFKSGTMSMPAAWTLLWAWGGTRAKQYVWWKFADSEGATVTITGSTSSRGVISLMTLQDAAEPDAWGNQGFNSNNTTHRCPSITVTATRSRLVSHAVAGWDPATYTPPGGMTEIYDLATGGTATGVVATLAHQELTVAGATGVRDFICSQSYHYGAGQVAIPAILS